MEKALYKFQLLLLLLLSFQSGNPATAKDPVKRFDWMYDTFDDNMAIKLELYNYVITRCRLNYNKITQKINSEKMLSGQSYYQNAGRSSMIVICMNRYIYQHHYHG